MHRIHVLIALLLALPLLGCPPTGVQPELANPPHYEIHASFVASEQHGAPRLIVDIPQPLLAGGGEPAPLLAAHFAGQPLVPEQTGQPNGAVFRDTLSTIPADTVDLMLQFDSDSLALRVPPFTAATHSLPAVDTLVTSRIVLEFSITAWGDLDSLVATLADGSSFSRAQRGDSRVYIGTDQLIEPTRLDVQFNDEVSWVDSQSTPDRTVTLVVHRTQHFSRTVVYQPSQP